MNEALVLSVVLLWIVVVILGIAVVALARQVGVLYERVAPAGALMINNSIELGEPVPRVEAVDFNTHQPITIGKPTEDGRSLLVFFLSPDCPVCKSLLPVLNSSRTAENSWLDILLASDGDMTTQKEFIDRYDLAQFPYVVSQELGMTYQISKLPYAVLIDGNGLLTSSGLINSREHLESLFEAKERKIDSIQTFIEDQQKNSAH